MPVPHIELTPAVVAALCHGLLISSVTAELAWLRASGRLSHLSEARVALGMATGAVVLGVAYTAVLAWIWIQVAPLAPAALEAVWREHPMAAIPVAFACWDATGWAYHRVGHGTAWGWAAHRPHHTGTEFHLGLALRQSWLPWHGLLIHPLLALLGFRFETIVICSLVSNLWQAWEHSAAPVPVPAWVRALMMTPATHRLHHRVDGSAVNLGPVLTIWDRLAGTWAPATAGDDGPYGIEGAHPGGVIASELGGWMELLHRGDGAPAEPRGAVGRAPVAV